MIISVTGKPCSGKGTASKLFCKKYNFEYTCTGDMFRAFASDFGFDNILEFQKNFDIKKIDRLVDDKTVELGKTRIDDGILIDSRLAWHFIPNSFKVFIDLDWETAGERLLSAERENEKAETLDQAISALTARWEEENNRYMDLYGVNNLNLEQYDVVISSKNKTPEQVMEEIHSAYINFLKTKK